LGDAQFRHEVRVRYGEVDLQGVVFNAHYLAYCDDAVDTWLRTIDIHFERLGWDIMLVKALVEWSGSAGIGDTLVIDLAVTRWGRTSFDVGLTGVVEDALVFSATNTYVGIKAGTTEPMPPPPDVRRVLGGG
jgi:acyl-CoA thioester hydrolase